MARVKVVLFLGAGFSRQFGLPVMTEFPDYARAHRRVDPEAAKLLSEVILEARGANSFLKSHPKNIEDILTFSEMSVRLGLDDGRRTKTLRRILQTVYGDPPREALTRAARQLCSMLEFPFDPASRASEDFTLEDLSVITTNYDLLPEALLHEIGCAAKLACSDGGNTFTMKGSSWLYSQANPGAIPIFKLHGSTNWSNDGEHILVDNIIRQFQGAPALPMTSITTRHDGPEPLIVAPSFLKAELPDPMKAVWSGAAKALQEANHLVFIGYSFPDSDTEMAYFLATALSKNAHLSQIRLIDPVASKIVARLNSPTSRYGNHFVDLLNTHEGTWDTSSRLPIPFAWSRSKRMS